MIRVDWLQSELDRMTNFWLQADSVLRQAITAACNTLDRRLSRDPWNEGESRSGRRRFTFVAPLAVTFRIEPDGQTVTVLHVRLYQPRRKK